ncbi:AAA family ATPase [Mycolicibacterium sp. BiH015]|uniref:helix-turn-helix transcriptional regulator n=1 Tax=Mycolicibacterium sp. BiH015 TaxID=3018808 RepID=UPI0022E481E0|nr:AAA family ATPase [Mycolicibacterium sp. BiH015]MDA2893926.1 AAA family ATPase [Mycolicibacterium sp. BiH015]
MNDSDYAAVIAAFLGSVARQPAVLLIEGEPGIGKTTLWLAAQQQARDHGFRVLATRASSAEAGLAFVGLDDLLGEADADVIDALPAAKRDALRQVSIRAGGVGSGVDRRVVAAAFLSIIDELASRTPVLLSVDDVHWIDDATRDVLAYAFRRTQGRVGLLATEQFGGDQVSAASWLDLGRSGSVARLAMGPMSIGQLHHVISRRMGRSFPRSTMAHIAEASGGNPRYALELAHTLDSATSAWTTMSPPAAGVSMGLRVGPLDSDAYDVLLAAACVAEPTVELLASILHRPAQEILSVLEELESRDILSIDTGRVRFSHPYLAHTVYSQARPADRRRIHAAAAAVESVPERRARHLALAATTADRDTLLILDAAAKSAKSKAAPAAAAELLEFAIGLGGDTASRRVEAAQNHTLAGDVDRSLELLQPIVAALPPGHLRARARMLVGVGSAIRGDFERASEDLQHALVDGADDPVITIRTHLTLAMMLSVSADPVSAHRHSYLARERAEEFADRSLLSQALAVQVLVRFLSGGGTDEVSLQRALDLQQRQACDGAAALFSARVAKALVAAWTGRLVDARPMLREAMNPCSFAALNADTLWVNYHAAMADIWIGRYDDALSAADDMVLGAEQLSSPPARAMASIPRAWVYAIRGRELDTRSELASIRGPGTGSPLPDGPQMVLGFLELSLGHYAAAVEVLHPLLKRRSVDKSMAITGWSFLPDLLEAAFAQNLVDEFAPWVQTLEDSGAKMHRQWMIATGARCRILLLVARGDIDAAEAATGFALDAHQGLPMPIEVARTQLVVGQVLRRARQKSAARDILGKALATFEELGAPLWVQRARTELGRVTAVPSQDLLTPSELRVGELAASGMTTKNIAAAMYVSPKTVEHHLSRIYRKLGIRGRAELGRQIDMLREDTG